MTLERGKITRPRMDPGAWLSLLEWRGVARRSAGPSNRCGTEVHRLGKGASAAEPGLAWRGRCGLRTPRAVRGPARNYGGKLRAALDFPTHSKSHRNRNLFIWLARNASGVQKRAAVEVTLEQGAAWRGLAWRGVASLGEPGRGSGGPGDESPFSGM